MSLVTYNGKLLLTNGKLTTGPAAAACCCGGGCDDLPATMYLVASRGYTFTVDCETCDEGTFPKMFLDCTYGTPQTATATLAEAETVAGLTGDRLWYGESQDWCSVTFDGLWHYHRETTAYAVVCDNETGLTLYVQVGSGAWIGVCNQLGFELPLVCNSWDGSHGHFDATVSE